MKLEKRVILIIEKNNQDEISLFIKEYEPFILKVLAAVNKGYIQVENDAIFQVGLEAFYEAMLNFDPNKGSFLTFARLVITSRAKSYKQKEYSRKEIPIDEMVDKEDIYSFEEMAQRRQDIAKFKEKLEYFSISLDQLVDKSPKHIDSRENLKEISKILVKDKEILDFLYLKKRLPITQISRKYNISIKTLKRNKIFIISLLIILNESYESIESWIF